MTEHSASLARKLRTPCLPNSPGPQRLWLRERRRLAPRFALGFLLGCLLFGAGCRTPDGPHIPISDLAFTNAMPPGKTRVVFINIDYSRSRLGAGPIQIQLNGKQLPSLWPERYVQTFLEPGDYELLLENWWGGFWTRREEITIEGDRMLIEVYKPLFALSPRFDFRDDLPSDFETAFKSARHPDSW